MRYKTINGKYRQQCDKKCQFRLGDFTEIIIKTIKSITYDNIGLAQKLQYFWSPIKNTYW